MIGLLAFMAAAVAAYLGVVVAVTVAAGRVCGRDFLMRHAFAFEAGAVLVYAAIMWGAASWIF